MRECMPGRRQGDTRRACRAVRPGLWRAECRRQTAQRCGGLRLQQVHQVLLLSGDVSGAGHHGKEIAAGEDRRQELAYLRTGLFVMHAGVSGDGRCSRPVHLCRAGKAPAQALDHAIRHAIHMAQQMADSGHTQHQVTFGQKTAYYTQVMETVFADSIHGLCFFMRRKRRPPSCAARCVHRTAFPAYHHCLPAETPAEQTLMF